MKPQNYLSLLVTAGNGPAECNTAVGHVLDRMQSEALRNLSLYFQNGGSIWSEVGNGFGLW